MSDASFPPDQVPRTENSADIEGMPTFSGHDVLDDQNQYVGKVTDVIYEEAAGEVHPPGFGHRQRGCPQVLVEEPAQLARAEADPARQLLDAAVVESFAETAARSRIDRKILRATRIGVLWIPPATHFGGQRGEYAVSRCRDGQHVLGDESIRRGVGNRGMAAQRREQRHDQCNASNPIEHRLSPVVWTRDRRVRRQLRKGGGVS